MLIKCRCNKSDLTHGVLYWGDERGNVSAVEFQGCRDMCFFSVGFLSFSVLTLFVLRLIVGLCSYNTDIVYIGL